jgi:hypothetical protein
MNYILNIEAIKSLKLVQFFKYREARVLFDSHNLDERCIAYTDRADDTETPDAAVWALFGDDKDNHISAIVATPSGEELALRWSEGNLYIGPGKIVAGEYSLDNKEGELIWQYRCPMCKEYHYEGPCYNEKAAMDFLTFNVS